VRAERRFGLGGDRCLGVGDFVNEQVLAGV
jgi:hypothetical protein